MAWTQIIEPGPKLLLLILAVTVPIISAAPFDDLEEQTSEIEYYPVADATGCYYNFEHYDEGDRIITNEPCLNCTCHNRMLMCYLRVCPFTKAIGQDCKVEKKPDQCCPVITCPEVPVQLLPHASTTPSTALGHLNEYGCSIDNLFYADGAKVPSNPNNPCEVCYCIRNKTACIIQECTLTGKVVEGCRPVYVDGVCCPVRYDCDHPELETTPRPLLTTTTTTLPPTSAPTDCIFNQEVYSDGALVKKDIPCEQCYCMRGDIVCAVQECGPTPLDKVNCTALPTKEGQCCPDTYECENISEEDLTTLTYNETPTTHPTDILTSETLAPSNVEEAPTTIEGEEKINAATEKQITESIIQDTEESGAAQPVTDSAIIETFTSKITHAVDAITSRVTDIVDAFTSVITESSQEDTKQPEEPETQTGEPAGTVPESTETVTENVVKETTEPEISVTQKASQEQEIPDKTKTTVAESATELFEMPAHDFNEDELPHEDENEIAEGSGEPTDEHVPSVTPSEEIEDKHTRPIDLVSSTTPAIESEVITTEKLADEVTEGSGATEAETPVFHTEPQPTMQTFEPQSYVKQTISPQEVTEEPTKDQTTVAADKEEKSSTTQEYPVTDAEAQETIQPLKPEISTEQTKLETPAVPEIETEIKEEEETHRNITEEPEGKTTEKTVTGQSSEAITISAPITPEGIKLEEETEQIPSEDENETTIKSMKEDEVQSITEETVTATEMVGEGETTVSDVEESSPLTTTERKEPQIITTEETEKPESMDHTSELQTLQTDKHVTEPITQSIEESGATQPVTESATSTEKISEGKPIVSDVKESKPVTTTEREEPQIITEIPTKLTEKPESMDHISETALPTTTVTVTEVIKEETTEVLGKGEAVTETVELVGVTDSVTEKTESYATSSIISEASTAAVPPEIIETCGDKDCKVKPQENEIPTEVEESCTKESCKPQEQIPSAETSTDKDIPTACESEHGCPPPVEEGSKISTETTDKETKLPVGEPDISTEATPDISEKCDGSDCKTALPVESSELDKLTTESIVSKTETTSTEESEGVSSEKHPASQTDQPEYFEGSGEGNEHTTTEKYEPSPTQQLLTEDHTESSGTEPEQESTEKEAVVTEAQTTIGTDLEKTSGITTVSEKVTQVPADLITEVSSSTETTKEKETEAPLEPDLAVSPISPEPTEVPQTVAASTTEFQERETPSYTKSPEGEKEHEADKTSEQPDIKQTQSGTMSSTEVEPVDETTPSFERVTHQHITETEVASITESNIPEETRTTKDSSQEQEPTEKSFDITQTTPTQVDSQTADIEIKPSEGSEDAETVVPTGTEIPAMTETEETESSKITPETETTKYADISERIPGSEESSTEHISEITTQDTQSPIVSTTEQQRADSTEIVGIPKETATFITYTPSEKTSTDASETEVPVSVTQPAIETTLEPEEEHGIPGEGSCLVDGQTYKNNSQVPPINQCQVSCKCISSILQCESIPCSPPPTNMQCTPMFHSQDACCPIYSCSVPGVTSMEADSHVMETTTVGEEALITSTQARPSEEGVTPELTTEKKSDVTSQQPEIITDGLKEAIPEPPSEKPEISEQLPTEIPVATTEKNILDQTTQKVVTETETVVPVTQTTETGSQEGLKQETVLPESQTTTVSESVTKVPVTEPSEEHIPSHDETENEIPIEPSNVAHCGSEGCVPERQTELPQEEIVTSLPDMSPTAEPNLSSQPESTSNAVTEVEEKLPQFTTEIEKKLETTISSITEPKDEVEGQTEGPNISEKEPVSSITTESGVTQTPIEGDTKPSLTEQPQDEINTKDSAKHATTTESSDFETSSMGITEVPSEESSKTPEEVAAAPEMEEAVTTPSVLSITENVFNEISPKVSETTTVGAEEEHHTASEKAPDAVKDIQPTTVPTSEIPSEPQHIVTSTPAEEGTKEESETQQPTLPSAESTERSQSTEVAETTIPELEHITESNVAITRSPLESEAFVTEITEKEKPSTETIPESTSKQVPKETYATTEALVPSQTENLPEEITKRVPVAEQPTEIKTGTEPVETKPTTVINEIVSPTTIQPEEIYTKGAESTSDKQVEVSVTENDKETTPIEIGDFPTHATDTKEASNTTPSVSDSEEPTKTTESLATSRPSEETIAPVTEAAVTQKEEPTYTSSDITTPGSTNTSELYTSGPKAEFSTEKSVEGELSTSVPVTPVSPSEPSTSAPPQSPAPAPGHDIPGEQIPDLPDYHSPVDDYEDEDQSPLGPGTCRYGGKVYVSAQQIPRDDPCDFCFCFRSDIICLQQSCPPPIPRCHEEPIRGFCCPRYECPVGMATAVNVTTSTTTTTTTLPPHFLSHAYRGRVTKSGCQIKGRAYQVGEVIPSASGPCLHCTCGGDGEMKCDPKACSPEPMLRQMIAAAVSRRRR